MKEIADILFSFPEIIKIMISRKVRIVYIHYAEAVGLSAIAAAKIFGAKSIVLWPTSSLRHFKMTENRFSFLINRIFTREADVFIAKGMSTNQMKQYLRIRNKNLYASVNPVEYKDYFTEELKMSAPEKLKILYLGKYNDFKRADFLVSSITLLPYEKRNKLNVDLYGNGPDEKSLNEYIEKNGLNAIVHVNPPSGDVKKLLSDHHVYIYPSPFEPAFSQSILESLCAGRITVCRYTQGIARYFKDGRDIIGIRDMNAKSISDKISWILDNYEEAVQIAERGRAIVREQFTFIKFFSQTDKIVKEGIHE